jgi:predicted nucleic acid-binding protein
MIYLDTSIVVPMFVNEPSSDAVDAWLEACADTLVSSDWLITEFASAVSIKERNGELSNTKAIEVRQGFESFCAGLRLVPVSRAAFHDAARLAAQQEGGLRVGDALHLAVAREVGATSLATLDNKLADNAKQLALDVETF